jgi:hypothetical protein
VAPSSGTAVTSGSGGAAGSSASSGTRDAGTHDATAGSIVDAGGSGGGGGAMHHDAAPVVLTGCAATVPSAVFGASCENRACHNATDHEYDLDLQSANVASRLVNVPALEVPALKLVDPVAPMNSFILLKVTQSMPPAGVQMPQMGAKLSASQIACLQQWVVAEAAGPY